MSTSSGLGLLGTVGVVFVTLKLIGVPPVSDWSWWWVTAPFWGGFALAFLILAVIDILMAIQDVLKRAGR